MKQRGFSMSEILIVLSALALIATFTIPKIIASSQTSQKKAQAQETLSAIAKALLTAKSEVGVDASTTFADLTPYLNYVGIDSITNIDAGCNVATINSCSGGGLRCLKLHNGGLLRYETAVSFNGTSNLNALRFFYDEDGVYSNTTKAIVGYLYYDGGIRTMTEIEPSTTNSLSTYNPSALCGPDWFSWD